MHTNYKQKANNFVNSRNKLYLLVYHTKILVKQLEESIGNLFESYIIIIAKQVGGKTKRCDRDVSSDSLFYCKPIYVYIINHFYKYMCS